jgi:hypothetical protein
MQIILDRYERLEYTNTVRKKNTQFDQELVLDLLIDKWSGGAIGYESAGCQRR